MSQPTSKFDHYAAFCFDWARTSLLGVGDLICLVAENHYPKNLRQYAANEILLRTTALEYGVTP
jgi:hypothetical protein